MKSISYVPPVYECLQIEKTEFDSNNVSHSASYHNKASLVSRLNNGSLVVDSTTAQLLSNTLPKSEPVGIDTSRLSEEQLFSSAPDRYLQTQSEQVNHFKSASEDLEAKKKEAIKQTSERKEKERLANEQKDFTERLTKLFSEDSH